MADEQQALNELYNASCYAPCFTRLVTGLRRMATLRSLQISTNREGKCTELVNGYRANKLREEFFAKNIANFVVNFEKESRCVLRNFQKILAVRAFPTVQWVKIVRSTTPTPDQTSANRIGLRTEHYS